MNGADDVVLVLLSHIDRKPSISKYFFSGVSFYTQKSGPLQRQHGRAVYVTLSTATAQHFRPHLPQFPVSASSVCSRIVKFMSASTLYCTILWFPCTVTSCMSLRVLRHPLHVVFKSQSPGLECIPLPPLCGLSPSIVATNAKFEYRTRAEAAWRFARYIYRHVERLIVPSSGCMSSPWVDNPATRTTTSLY